MVVVLATLVLAGTATAATRPDCFGAAARDFKNPCSNPTLSVIPLPGGVDLDPGSSCRPIEEKLLIDNCAFGYSGAKPRDDIALVGDSHSYHWRAALNVVADTMRWSANSISLGGCVFSAAVVRMFEGPRAGCTAAYHAVQQWFRDHPEVSTMFVSQNSDTVLDLKPGESELAVKVAGFRRAWRALPKTVTHIVVIRDNPQSTQDTVDCVLRVIAEGTQQAGPVCPARRSVVLKPDRAVQAARSLRAKRYRHVDLTEFFCDRRNCYPVVGGALTNTDIFGHISVTYARTLGPYLLRKMRKLMATW
ncbi:MAG TPA: SGNH hydrolase domain-containing protein [Solirubrobacteraceae bacterium]|nr:SGNH hydrolase domain-containing protein [Solirubrobacteraceae bacterium]